MFIFGSKGYNKGKKIENNGNANKSIFLDYVLFVANVVILLVLLTCILIKSYSVLLEHVYDSKNELYLELSQLIIFLLTITISVIYCHKKTKKMILVSRCLFLINILFNIFVLFGLDLISKWEFKINYNQIINNIINLVVLCIILVDCIITYVKITKENSKTLKNKD